MAWRALLKTFTYIPQFVRKRVSNFVVKNLDDREFGAKMNVASQFSRAEGKEMVEEGSSFLSSVLLR
jgi:hypothetical protein